MLDGEDLTLAEMCVRLDGERAKIRRAVDKLIASGKVVRDDQGRYALAGLPSAPARIRAQADREAVAA